MICGTESIPSAASIKLAERANAMEGNEGGRTRSLILKPRSRFSHASSRGGGRDTCTGMHYVGAIGRMSSGG